MVAPRSVAPPNEPPFDRASAPFLCRRGARVESISSGAPLPGANRDFRGSFAEVRRQGALVEEKDGRCRGKGKTSKGRGRSPIARSDGRRAVQSNRHRERLYWRIFAAAAARPLRRALSAGRRRATSRFASQRLPILAISPRRLDFAPRISMRRLASGRVYRPFRACGIAKDLRPFKLIFYLILSKYGEAVLLISGRNKSKHME